MLETINFAKNSAPSHRKINGKTLTQDVQLIATSEVLRVEIPVGVPLPDRLKRPPADWSICNGGGFDKEK
ncbi:MAG: hypothetical protein ACL7BU_06010 [Candidatus Phlomobacter fragariae]